MIHRYHPDPDKIDDSPNALLYDDCDRCAQQAADPRMLDNTKLAAAYTRCKQDDWTGTGNERKLFGTLYVMWCVNQHLDAQGVLLP